MTCLDVKLGLYVKPLRLNISEYNWVCHINSQQTKDKVKLLIQLADNLVEKGHAHVSELKRWVSTVDRRYRDFSLRMAKYQESLERSLGVSSEVNDQKDANISQRNNGNGFRL